MLEKLSVHVREAINVIAGPREIFDSRDRWLARAAEKAGVTFRSMRSAFYGEIKDPEHKVIRRIMSAAEVKARREANELAEKFQTIANGLNATDPDFYQSDIAALINAARILSRMDRT